MKPLFYRKLFESKTKNAHLITFDDGDDYVVKLYKPSENKALMNEWVAYCIARFMGLPIPYAYLIEMPKEFVDNIPKVEEGLYTSKQFANKFIPNSVNAHETEIKSIINHRDLASIIVFDYWLCNNDRTRKNILLQEATPGKQFLWVIDHAEIFDSYSWTINDLENLPNSLIESATHQLMGSFIQDEKDLKRAVRKIQSIPIQLLEEILSFIPNDWNVSLEEKQELVKALHYRRHYILPKLVGDFVKKVYRPLHQ